MASLTPPTSLATFSSSHASSSRLPHVVLSRVAGKQTGLAVAAVQGDGVWTYDLSTQRPTTSFTVPPTTTFATSPVSFYPSPRIPSRTTGKQKADDELPTPGADDVLSVRTTIIGVDGGEKVHNSMRRKVVWVWKGEEGSLKSVIQLDHALQGLYYIPGGSSRAVVLCVHTDGHLTVLDCALSTRSVNLGSYLGHAVIAANVVSVAGQTVRAALLDKKGNVAVVELNVGGPQEIVGTVVKSADLLDGSKSLELSSATISEGGAITAVTNGKVRYLISRSIADLAGTLKSFPSLVHNNTSAPVPLPLPGRPLALVAVNEPSPTILLVSTSPALPAVLLSSSLATLAPTSSSSITHLTILDTLSPGRFVLGVTLTFTSEDGGRTVVYTVELSVPEKGVGMSALLGTYKSTLAYFALQTRASKIPAFESFIDDLKRGLENGKEGAGFRVFEKWLAGEEAQFKPQGKVPAPFTLPENQVKPILETVFNAALRKVQKNDEGEAALEPTGKYEPRIVNVLISRKWVHDDLYPPSVLSALLALDDWSNASRAVRTIANIPSSALVSMISKSIHPSIDAESPLASLHSVLRDILDTPVPAPDYRIALRLGLSVEDATEVLQVFAEWMAYAVQHSDAVLNGWTDERKTRKQREADSEREEQDPIPSLKAMINYASVLLDSHLPLFLTHTPSHTPLETLQSCLTPLLALQENYRKLRAPVEAALTLSKREQQKLGEAQAKRDQVRLNTLQNGTSSGAGAAGAAKKAKASNAAKAGAILPDEAVGKWRVEQFVF